MNPEHPQIQQGTAQNPDIYFQNAVRRATQYYTGDVPAAWWKRS